jgi:capsular polysaccharide biosynthesis protein
MTRRGLLVLAAALVAAAAACLVTAMRPVTYTGQVELVVGHGNAPLDPQAPRDARLARALRELVASHVLAANVIRSMDLDESQGHLLRRLDVDMPQPAVLSLSVRDTHRRQATELASTTALVFIRLVQSRFGIRGYGMPVRATIWDPARATREDRVGHILENGMLAGVVALIAGLGFSRLPLRPAPEVPLAAVEPIRPAPEPEPQPEPEPEPEPEIPPAAVVPLPGNPRRNVRVLEQLVENRGPEFPDRVDEWRYYVVYLHDFAAPDGTLPESLAGLVDDVFADLLGRAA